MKSLIAVSIMTLSILASGSTGANTINVNTTDDELNVDGDCSLREAFIATNTDFIFDACPAGTGDDTIMLPAGTYTLDIPPDPTPDDAADGDLDITENLTIIGSSASSTILDGGGIDRVLHICPASSCSSANVTLSNITIRNGNAGSSMGGGIFNDGLGALTISSSVISGNTAQNGGGIFSQSIGGLSMTDSAITENSSGSNGGGGLSVSTGDLDVTRSTLSGNATSNQGGAIQFSTVTNQLNLVNCTLSDNESDKGGAIFHITGGSITSSLTNCTITQNSANQGANILNMSGVLQIANTIIADGLLSNNCSNTGTITSLGNNIDSGNSCGFVNPPDLIDTDPLLGPLEDNGGPTQTHILLTGSPAIDAGNNEECPSPDQRGVSRPQDGNGDGTLTCDIGATELSCGNDILEAGEECDDGNLTNGDGCSASCANEVAPACGDGILQAGEECDDSNLISGDGCDSTCLLESNGGGGCSLLRH